MMESILLKYFLERHPNCNGEMLIIDGSNAGIGGDNNLLASLKSRLQDRL